MVVEEKALPSPEIQASVRPIAMSRVWDWRAVITVGGRVSQGDVKRVKGFRGNRRWCDGDGMSLRFTGEFVDPGDIGKRKKEVNVGNSAVAGLETGTLIFLFNGDSGSLSCSFFLMEHGEYTLLGGIRTYCGPCRREKEWVLC